MPPAVRAPITFGARVRALAAAHPDRTAVVFVPVEGAERRVSWRELDQGADRAAHALDRRGLVEGGTVVVALPNSIEHLLVAIGAWRLGAIVLPLSPALAPLARDPLLATAGATLAAADWSEAPVPVLGTSELAQALGRPAAALPDRAGRPGKAVASGGSTGRPKVVVDPAPWETTTEEIVELLGPAVGIREGQVQLIGAALYHNVPFLRAHYGLFLDHTLVLMEKFDAQRWVDLVVRHRVSFTFLVPTMMGRIVRRTDVRERDLSGLEAVSHSAAPTPEWLKREWIALVGAERLYETYGASEMAGMTSIRGDEWLSHPGSVGRPRDAEIRVVDERGIALPRGEVGEVFVRDRRNPGAPYRYLGGPPPKTSDDGFVTSGDLGWIDADGYLYLADRRVDLIISGGANVYAAEVEAALSQHPAIDDVAVIGIPDADWGKRVHAVVQPVEPGSPPSAAELDAHCRERLAPYKCPKTYEFVRALARNDAGKIQRSALVAERT